jgi:hypothetical protein
MIMCGLKNHLHNEKSEQRNDDYCIDEDYK